MDVPCGRCYQCREKYAKQWAFRLKQEKRRAFSCYFLTLTYAEETIPLDDKGYTFNYDDVKNFIKRCRAHEYRTYKVNPKEYPIKYYCVGERGDQYGRPHYHLAIFNIHHYTILKEWTLGLRTISELTDGRIQYTLKYMIKSKDDEGELMYMKPKMSKGLGDNYITKHMIDYHKKKLIPYVTEKGGFKVPMPQYYRNVIFKNRRLRDILNKKTLEYIYLQKEEDSINVYRKQRNFETAQIERIEKALIINNKK